MTAGSAPPDPRRTACGFSDAAESLLVAEGIPPSDYELWIVGFLGRDEGLRFDGSADALCISDLHVFGPLGEGTGGKVLRVALRLADELDLTLVLNPWALMGAPEGALAQGDLEDWYARLGFVWEPDPEQHLMARAPGTPVPEPRRSGFAR